MFPSIFISHADPSIALDGSKSHNFLKTWGSNLGKPKAIIIMSAHWEAKKLSIGCSKEFNTIHDFSGFENELYDLRYKAKSDSEIANKIKELFLFNKIECDLDEVRGLDHGSWIPLSLMYPNADVPVIQISVQPELSAEEHFKIGKILDSFRNDYLIIGSGSLTHNLREAFSNPAGNAPEWVINFSNWVYSCLENNNFEELFAWKKAEYGLKNHPTPEHFLPFFFALGAAGSRAKYSLKHSEVRYRVLMTDMIEFS